VSRTLITTADERTWPKDKKQPVLFLGEWCRRYRRKEVWQQLNAEVAAYHWDDRNKLIGDYQYLQNLYEKLLVDLSDKLNQIHSTDHSPRYWRILIGPWLGYFIQMLFDRWFMLKQVIEQTEITECRVLERELMKIVPNDMVHFTKLFVDDDWNEAVYGQLLELYWGDVVNIEKIRTHPVYNKHADNASLGVKAAFKRHVERWVSLFNKLFPKDDSYFFISSYLPLKTDFKLQMSLGQFPKLWRRQSAPVTKPDIQQRQWRLGDHKLKDASFDVISRQLIPLHIPTAYLEGYEELVTTADLLDWPKKPKTIFTSNAYSSDDLFKSWAAEKTESGTTLVIGQHGGHFGMTPFSFSEEHQINIADKWLSWGWADKKRPQITPVGCLKAFGRSVGYDPNGRALMVEMILPRYSYDLLALPVSRQWLDYLDDQQKFLKTLPYELREQVLLRLYPNDYGWDVTVRWKDKMPEVQIDPGNQNIRKLIKKCRIYISTYNATTYLESLSWNVPTIIFWNPENWELKEEVKPYFELLKSVGIFHETPESAAQQMIKVWSDVASWWESDDLQIARKQFCHQFARMSDDPVSCLQGLFKDISNGHDSNVSK
jgi:putative transferase (TIGR04331 family)